MANVNFLDVKLPFSETGGALETVEGSALASQRIVYGYTISSGDIVHRPEWGASLEDFANAKPTPTNVVRLENQARRFLNTLHFLEAYTVEVEADGDSAVIMTEARTDEGELLLPEVVI
jgi:hypothetical protein